MGFTFCTWEKMLWSYVVFFSLITILLLTHEVFSNLHIVGNDVLHHHHPHSEVRHKHYMYPVPVYYHGGPKPHLHPYPYHIDGEAPAAKVHRGVRPIPIGKKRKRRRIGRRRKRHGKRPVLQIPVIHHHHPPDVVTEPPIYQSALRNLLATPVPSLAGHSHIRRRSSPLIVAPVIRQAAAPRVRWRPTILQRARPLSRPVVRRASVLRSPAYSPVIQRPILSGSSFGSSGRIDNSPIIYADNPFGQNSFVGNKRPILQSSFLKQKPFMGSSMISSDSSFDQLPILDDDGPIVYETGGPMESSFFEDGPPILESSLREDHPFKKSSVRRSEHQSSDEIIMESPFLDDKPSGSSRFIMDHKPQERPPFLEDESPIMFGSSKYKDSDIVMESPMEEHPPFTSDYMFSKKSSMLDAGEIMEASEEYKPFTEFKTSFRKSSIMKDEDFMESMTREKPPTEQEIIMDDSSFKESSIIRDKPFTEDTNDDELFESMGKSPPSMRESDQLESLFDNEPIVDDGVHFVDDDNDVPFKRSVNKNEKKLSQNVRRDTDNSQSRNHQMMAESLTDNGLFVRSSFQKDNHENAHFHTPKTLFPKEYRKEYLNQSPSYSDAKFHKTYALDLQDKEYKDTEFISEKPSHDLFGNEPSRNQEESKIRVLDKSGDYISFDKEIDHNEKSSQDIMSKDELFYMNENSNLKPWDIATDKGSLSENLDHPPYHFDKHTMSNSEDIKQEMTLNEGIENISKDRNENFDHSKVKSSDQLFEYNPQKGMVPISRTSNEVMHYASSSHGHFDIEPDSKYLDKKMLHNLFQKENKDFIEEFPHEISEHSKFSDKILYDHNPLDKHVTPIAIPPHETFNIISHHASDGLGGSRTIFFDHIPFKKEGESIEREVMKFSNEELEHTPFDEENETVGKHSEEAIVHDSHDEGKNWRTKASYKIFKHMPSALNKETLKSSSKRKNTGKSTRRPLKLTRIKDNSLQIPLIADLPKPFNINKISTSSVSDKERNKFQPTPTNDREENSKKQQPPSNRDNLERQEAKSLNNMNFKNVDFKDVKLLTTNTSGGSVQVSVHYLPERD